MTGSVPRMSDDPTQQPEEYEDDSVEDFVEEMENDPARNPDDDELKQIQGG